jgi:hypothetical protein
LEQFRPFKLTVEATASYHWFVALVQPLAQHIVLANPIKLRVVAPRATRRPTGWMLR